MNRLYEYTIHRETDRPVPFCWRVLATVFAVGMLLVMTAIFTSCSEEYELEPIVKGAPATIQLHVMEEEPIGANTRTINDASIVNLHILIYANGELIGQKYATSNTITITTRSAANCNIYAIANTGNANLFNNYSIHSEQYLKDLIRSISTWDELTNGSTLLMTGVMTTNINPGNSTLPNMAVKRIASKITLAVSVEANYGIIIDNYGIYNIPKKSYYVLRPLASENTTDDPAATRTAGDAVTSNAGDWMNSGNLSPASSTTINTTFYMFENRAGVNTYIGNQKDKTQSNARDHATYIEINGKALGYKKLTWRIYLGANNTNNFNIKRNSAYSYRITLKPNDSDTRIAYNYTTWAGSNIYWNGSKLTFDETTNISNNNDLKQGVFFRWGSLIGVSAFGNPAYFIPYYNAGSPGSSTWGYSSYVFNNIYCFYGTESWNSNNRSNAFLNDANNNTDDSYRNYRGDICKYLTKTGAAPPGNWRMPTSEDFGEPGNYTNSGDYSAYGWTEANGTTRIYTYRTYTSAAGIIRFPATGYRHNDGGGIYAIGEQGYHWSSSAQGSTGGFDFGLDRNGAYPGTFHDRQFGFTVRCVKN